MCISEGICLESPLDWEIIVLRGTVNNELYFYTLFPHTLPRMLQFLSGGVAK